MTESTVPDVLPFAAAFTSCPNTGHEGASVPATQQIVAHHGDGRRVETARCPYCGEGLVHRLLREDWVVTTWIAQTPATVPPTDGGGESAEAGHPPTGPAATPITEHRGYVVAEVRQGKAVIAEGFSAHADTLDEARSVADAWRELLEHVTVFELVEVTP